MIIAFGSRHVVWNRPRLVRLEGETDQSHEQMDVRGDIEPHRHPLRTGHQLNGSRCREVVFEPPDGPGREVQVNVVVGVEVGDLAVSRTKGSANAAARLRLGEIGPGRQLREGTRCQRHAPIMTSSPPSHQKVRNL